MNNKAESQEKLEGRLHKMIEQHGPTFWQALFQITGFYQHFGFCECGRMPITLNVHKSNFMYCKKCRTYWHVGGNLFGSWRHEDESVWRKNEELLSKARPIKPKRLVVSSGQLGFMTYEEIQEKEAKSERVKAGECEGQELFGGEQDILLEAAGDLQGSVSP